MIPASVTFLLGYQLSCTLLFPPSLLLIGLRWRLNEVPIIYIVPTRYVVLLSLSPALNVDRGVLNFGLIWELSFPMLTVISMLSELALFSMLPTSPLASGRIRTRYGMLAVGVITVLQLRTCLCKIHVRFSHVVPHVLYLKSISL